VSPYHGVCCEPRSLSIGASSEWHLQEQSGDYGKGNWLKDFADKPTLLIKPAAREQELNLGSTPVSSATTEARDARAA